MDSTTADSSDASTTTTSHRAARLKPAIAGILAALSALATTELIAGVSSAPTSLLSSVASLLIRIMPPAITEFGINTLTLDMRGDR